MSGPTSRTPARAPFFLALFVLLSLGLAGGVWSALAATESSSPDAGKVTLRLGWTVDVENLNPFIGFGSSYEVWCLNYDFLVGYDAKDGSPRPEIAESWETSPDGKVWTFHIRKGVTWQDGEPLTAKDVAFSLNYIVENQLASYSTYTKLIERAEVVDDYTVRVVCSKPKANMLRMYVYVLPEHIWSKVDPKIVEVSYKNSPPLIGSGPFQCVEWKKGQYVRMVANDSYWRGAPHVDEIIFEFYTNPDVMAQELRSGRLDGAEGLPGATFPAIEDDPNLEAIPYNVLTWDYLCFNCYADPASKGHPVLRDVKFRQALAWAVDRQKCADLGYGGYAQPGTTIITPGQWPADFDAHYEPTPQETFGFDLDKARQLLDEAGYRDTDGDGVREYKGKPIRLRLNARSDSQASQIQGKLIAGSFRDIGLTIDYTVIDPGALSDLLYATTDGGNTYAPDYDMYLWDWGGYIDPGDTLSSFITDQIWTWNDPCWSNAEFDRLADEQYSELDKQKRLDLLYRMQQIFYVEEPYVVVDYPDSLEAVNTAKWDGWTRFMGGPAFYSQFNMDSYLNLRPKAAAAVAAGSGSTTLVIVAATVAGLLVVAVVVVLLRRTRGRAMEE
jgi:peptide/nickel transport system substrate-binding protein